MPDSILLALLGYFIGALFMTLYDYLWKALNNPDLVFDRKYVASMLISTILSLMFAVVTFTTLQVPVDSAGYIMLSTIAMGFMVNHLINKPVHYLSKKRA